jgi:hypothetical protein
VVNPDPFDETTNTGATRLSERYGDVGRVVSKLLAYRVDVLGASVPRCILWSLVITASAPIKANVPGVT